jgi:hypothetical protein
MARRKAATIKDAIADAVEKEIKSMSITEVPSETGRGLDEELDFDNPNFGDITEEDYDD